MKISEFAVKNYQFTLIVFLGALALGVFSLFNMPKSEDPRFEAPTFFIVSVYPGTSAADMERLLVNPIEKRVRQFDDLRRVFSTAADGFAVTVVEYKFEGNANERYQEVLREINALRNELPPDLYSLDVKKITASDVNVYQYALISENVPYKELRRQAEELSDRLKKIKAIKNVEISGCPKENVRVNLNIEKIAQYKIPMLRIIGALQSENTGIPGGSISVGSKKFNVKTDGSYKELDEIRNTIVSSNGTKIIYLRDIAEVGFGYEDDNYTTRYNGHRAIFVNASMKDNQNILALKSQAEPVVEAFKKTLPKSIDFASIFDQTESVEKRLLRFAKDFGIAILLVLLTLLPLGTRASLVVMISIPLSLAIGLVFMNLFGYNINQLSIVGMILSLGILVDDSIVVVENIERHLREGANKREAAIEATKQIGLAVVGCTATLIFAFLPLLFLPEGSGMFIRSLPVAVVCTVFASMLVSLTIVPFLSSRLLSNHANSEGNFFLRLLKKIISGTYSKVLEKALNRPWTTVLISALLFFATLKIIPTLGFTLFPKSDKPMFLVDIEMPEGTNVAATTQTVYEVEKILKTKPLIRNIATNIAKGNPRIYYNVLQHGEAENYAQLFVQLGQETESKDKVALIDELRNELKSIPNTEISVKDFEQGPPIEAPLSYRLFCDNLDTLRTLSAKIETLVKETEGTIYVTNPLKIQPTDLKININKDKAGLLGIAPSDIDRTIRLGIAGVNIGKFRNDAGDEYNLNVSIPRAQHKPDMSVFDHIYINNILGTPYPLREVADITFEASTNQIKHYDFERFIAVSAFNKTGYITERVNQVIEEKLQHFKFPKGAYYIAAGEKESKQRSLGGMGTIVLITMIGFIGILILEFRTFKSTLIVLSVIPLGVIGAILMLFFTGNPLSFTAVIGFIALIGIEVKNSILLVDFTNQLREEGMELDTAIREAGEIRFVPIVLTSLTAIGGLIPLVIEFSPLYSPLALVLIGGLISSTLLSRLVTPVMYKLLAPSVRKE